MTKKIMGFAAGFAALGIGIIIFHYFFEVVEYTEWLPPSREARINEFLALDRWLVSEGFTVTLKNWGDLQTLKDSGAKVIIIQSAVFDWDRETSPWISEWVESGGRLVICLDYYRDWDTEDDTDNLAPFLDSLGLKAFDEEEEVFRYPYEPRSPSFGRNICFNEPAAASLILRDSDDLVRLVEFQQGLGKITVTSYPLFMMSYNIEAESNARLSWYLFAGPALHGGPGGSARELLFIRGEEQPSGIMDSFFERGNFTIVIIAALLLVIVGFWTVIPVFGVVRENKEKPGKDLAERFRAEACFLRRFNSLDLYRDAYLREIRRRFAAKKEAVDDEVVRGIAFAAGKKLRNKKEFAESIAVLKTILEQL